MARSLKPQTCSRRLVLPAVLDFYIAHIYNALSDRCVGRVWYTEVSEAADQHVTVVSRLAFIDAFDDYVAIEVAHSGAGVNCVAELIRQSDPCMVVS